jgi:hypothetical protein
MSVASKQALGFEAQMIAKQVVFKQPYISPIIVS